MRWKKRFLILRNSGVIWTTHTQSACVWSLRDTERENGEREGEAVCVCERERERERETERQRDRETERDRDRDRDRKGGEREAGRKETDRKREAETERIFSVEACKLALQTNSSVSRLNHSATHLTTHPPVLRHARLYCDTAARVTNTVRPAIVRASAPRSVLTTDPISVLTDATLRGRGK